MKTVQELMTKLPENIRASIQSYDGVQSDDLFQLFENMVYHENIEAFKAAIDAGVDLNLQNKYGWTLLHIAIRRNQKAMVAYLLDKGADINKKDGVGWTPLMEAIMDDMTELCGYLIERGADTKPANDRGATAFMLVQKFGRQSMMKFFK